MLPSGIKVISKRRIVQIFDDGSLTAGKYTVYV